MASYMCVMATTIQVSAGLLNKLKQRKLYDKESYEELIWDLLEDTMELSEQTKKEIEQSRKEAKEGKTFSLEEVKRQAGIR